jgi:peptide/nickel transport system ATP-binding protein
MDLIVELTKRRGMSTILITHDLGLAAAYCDRVVVMEKGRVVETALSADIFAKPEHAYTKKLMRATPRIGASLRDLLPEEEAAALPRPPVVMAGPDPATHPSSQDSSKLMDPRVKPGGDVSTSGKPLLLVEKLLKEYPRQGATATLTKLFSRKPPVETEQFRAVDGIAEVAASVGLVGDPAAANPPPR